MKTNPTRALAIAAGLVIVALTAAAFWLSYAHLAEVALAHGMQRKEIRAWAWPATLDLFIVAGELLMLRAALAGRVDVWAIGLTVVGSGSSIALNVAGVGSHAEPLDYVVAAVPPTAALLAFGALMRQIHQALADRPDVAEVADEVTVERVDDDQPPAAIEAARPLPEVVPAGVRLLPIVARPQPAEATTDGPLLRTYTDRIIDRYMPAAKPEKVVIPPLDKGVFSGAAKGSDLNPKATTSVPAETAREVVTEVIALSPAELRRKARALHRQVVRSTNRPVTIDRLREEFGLSRREAAELRREVVGTVALVPGEVRS